MMRVDRWIQSAVMTAMLCAAGGTFAQEKDGGGDRRARIRERMMKDDAAPKVGDNAPTFQLKSLDGKNETDLRSFRGKKPVVLFFGSYT